MKKLFQIIVNNGIIISIAIGMANLFAYYYQKGKLDYYDIPLIYVDLSIITIIQMVGLILSACILIFVLVNAVLESSFGVEDYRLCNMIIRTIFMLVVSSISIAFVRKLTYATLILLALYFITIITDYLMPIIKIKEKVSYSEKWKKYSELAREKNKEEDKIKNTGKFAKFRKKLVEIATYVCMLIVVCNCLYTAGLENAKDKEKYYIANDYEDKIIVHKTTEYYILMDENNKILEHQYEIVPSSEIGKISYKVTGKLSVEEI